MTTGKQLFRLLGSCALATGIAFACGSAAAKVRIEKVQYRKGEVGFQTMLAYDTAFKGKRPAILMGPTWTGPGEYTQGRAAQLAKMGYVVLIADIYGKGVHPVTNQQAAAESGKYMNDRDLYRTHARGAVMITVRPGGEMVVEGFRPGTTQSPQSRGGR